MADEKPTKDPSEPTDPNMPAERSGPKKGGFGAFREVYRARWAANHPDKGKPKPGAYTEASTPPDPSLDKMGREGQD